MTRLCFNAARGKWSVATLAEETTDPSLKGFNAARGKWSVATANGEIVSRLGMSSFNAARGKWSVATAPCRKPHDT